MPSPRLEFLPNDANENEGLGDAGIETFKDDPCASCGREAGQNSRDAAVSRPVRMTFDLMEVPTKEVPGIEELAVAVQACLKAAADQKEKDFFRQARDLLQRGTINILKIADFSTKGLQGPPNQPRTPFHSLVRSSGISSKESDTSGGSFGIGKNASFAVSDLQAVFYSTVYRDAAGAATFAAQGKVRLVSHMGPDGKPRRSIGYWGDPHGYDAVMDPALVPEWMRRTEVGTTIHSLGFREENAWAERITYSLLANFFVAIEAGDMEFEVDNGRLKINASTIAGLFQNEAIVSAARERGRRDDLLFSEHLHRCLVSASAVERTLPVPSLGAVTVRVLVADDLPRRIGIARNGMLITTSLEHFGDRLERFAGARDFVALVQPDEDASRLMKTLENPKHDSFSADRISDPVKRDQALKAMKGLIKALRSTIRELAAVPTEDEVLIDELTGFFAESPTEQRPKDPKTDHDPESYTYTPPKVRRVRKRDRVPGDDDDGGGGVKTGRGRGGVLHGRGAGPGEGGRGRTGNGSPVPLRELRNVMSDDSALGRTVWFTPDASGVAVMRLDATGVSSSTRLIVRSTNPGAVFSGDIHVDLVKDVRMRIDIEFDAPYAGPIEVAAHLIDEAA